MCFEAPKANFKSVQYPLTGPRSLALALPEQVENLAYCPDVLIADSYFSRIPTRGILMTSRGEANTRAGAGPGRAACARGAGTRGLLQAARAAV